ncbi:SlyX family protein [Vibrio quintilis]|nr:SlyX family protein [Vibrio quintilis]
MNDQQIQTLEKRINDLECQISFQEHTIETLNEALARQQQTISEMQIQMKYVVNKVKTMNESNLASQSEEAPPPHY